MALLNVSSRNLFLRDGCFEHNSEIRKVKLFASFFKNHNIVGSEYLGHEYESGSIIKGIRHEDVEDLSFQDNSLDIIVSNDVYEHVPNPQKAFRECARVLRDGGLLLATIPFHVNSDSSEIRAELTAHNVNHLLSPMYHGNPISADGSLVFTDFGWDLIQMIKESGFTDVKVDIYSSDEYGHLGGGQIVFSGNKAYDGDKKNY